MEKSFKTRTALAVTAVRIRIHVCMCHVLLRLLFEGGVQEYGIITTMAFVRLLLLLQLLLSTKNVTSRELKARNSLRLTQKIFVFESIAAP